ncbi:MAG: hypothetical protein E7365_00710 [Clostridiales bacterium]|nr:hypothetical protein [Clostridiales bacterium]
MNKQIEKTSRLRLKEKRKVYILRRVVFITVVFMLLFSLILCFLGGKSEQATIIDNDYTLNTYTPKIIITPEPTEKPLSILIYHTHNDEAYYKGTKNYIETDTGRTFDEKYNVIAVGEALKTHLEKYGYIVYHDKSDNVSEGFDYAYDTSLKNINKHGKNYDIYIDLHRDAFSEQTGKNYAKKLNKEYAFIRFVVANGTKYKEKPNYKENYLFAEKLNNEINLIFPDLAKDIFIKSARLNQHLSDKCILIEIGNERNDLQQAKNSTEIIAQAINKIL